MADLTAHYITFSDLLTNNLFRIPEYQRPYSWDNRQLDDLFGDIKKAFDNKEPHFMATVVCLKAEGEKKKVGSNELCEYIIVDGQQRLTTLIILLKAIQINFDQNNKEEREEADKLQNDILVRGNGQLILLQTNHDEFKIYDNYLRKGKRPSKEALINEPLKKLNQSFEKCEIFVNEWKTEENNLIDLLAIIKNKLGFIFYKLNNEKTVYTVFEVLNSRGLPVNALDKTKCILMSTIFDKYNIGGDNADRNAYTNIIKQSWIDIYNIIGIKSINDDEIVRFAGTLLLEEEAPKGKTLALEDALDVFRKLSENNVENSKKITEVLVEVAKYLKQLKEFPLYRFFHSISQVRFLYISLFLNKQLSLEERNEILWFWEKVSFRIYGLMGNDAKKNVGDYIRLGREIYHNNIKNPYEQHDANNKYNKFNAFGIKDKIINKLNIIGESAPIKIAANRLKDNNCYESWKDELRYFMFKYDCYLANKETNSLENNQNWKEIFSDSPIDTIEHIFPQTMNEYWKGKMGQGNKAENYINKIGNLVILPKKLNSECNNQIFFEKRKIYEKALSEIANDVIYEDYSPQNKRQYLKEWNKNEIEKREKRLIEVAKKIWK